MENKPKGLNKLGFSAVNLAKDVFGMWKNMDTDTFQKNKDQLVDVYHTFHREKMNQRVIRACLEDFETKAESKIDINKLTKEEYLRKMRRFNEKKEILKAEIGALAEEYSRKKEIIRKNRLKNQNEHEREYDWHMAITELNSKAEEIKTALLSSLDEEDGFDEGNTYFKTEAKVRSNFKFETPQGREREPLRYSDNRRDNQYLGRNDYFRSDFDNLKPKFDYDSRIKKERQFQMTPEEQIRSEFQGVASKSHVPMKSRQLEDSVLKVQSMIEKHNSVNDLKMCGLTGELCINPVSTIYGGVYEEESLRNLISLGGLCPNTKKKLKESDIIKMN